MAKEHLHKTKNIKCRPLIAIALAVILSIGNIQPAHATEEPIEISIDQEVIIKNTMSNAVYKMRTLIQDAYALEMEKIKKDIVDNGYDYFNTIESVAMYENPIRRINYADLISAYIVISTVDSNIEISTLPYFSYTIEEATYERKIPIKNNVYEKVAKNKYEKVGIEYIVEDCTIDTYEMQSNGYYKKTGTMEVVLDTEEIKYGIVTMTPLTGKALLEEYGITEGSDLYNEYLRRYQIIEICYSEETQNQSAFITVSRSDLLDATTKEYIDNLIATYDGTNLGEVIKTATYLIGRVPYQWGGKSQMAGYDTSWFTFADATGEQKGLDCSGYVQWVFRTAGYPDFIWQDLLSTSSILSTQQAISESELEIGDFGLLNYGETINHVGIYLGDGYWIHCNSSKDTVSVDKTTMFTVFRRCINMSNCSITPTNLVDKTQDKSYYTDSELKKLSKYVSTAGQGRGLNTWIALAEIAYNRINSNDYPSTIDEVLVDTSLYGFGESNLITEEPTEEMVQIVKDVLDGNLTIIGTDADCISFTPIESEHMVLIGVSEDIYFYDMQW